VADQAAQAARARRALRLTLIVVSGAPGTGKSTTAAALGAALRFPVLSLDPIKEALAEFAGATEVFCHRDPRRTADRVTARIGHGRHPIHRDVMNPAMADRAGFLAATVTPLELGAALVEVDTGPPGAGERAVTAVRARLR